jgi:glycerol-3-phosphate responsive antiterminator
VRECAAINGKHYRCRFWFSTSYYHTADKMRDNEMRRIIEEQINAIIILEQQMEDIKKQMQILQELIKEMKG